MAGDEVSPQQNGWRRTVPVMKWQATRCPHNEWLAMKRQRQNGADEAGCTLILYYMENLIVTLRSRLINSDRASCSVTLSSSTEAGESSVQYNAHLSLPEHRQHSTLLITFQVVIIILDGEMMKAWALMDCASSTSFVTERFAWQLQLPRQCQHTKVALIGGNEQTLSSCSVVDFAVANLQSLEISKLSGPHWKVEAVVLPIITT